LVGAGAVLVALQGDHLIRDTESGVCNDLHLIARSTSLMAANGAWEAYEERCTWDSGDDPIIPTFTTVVPFERSRRAVCMETGLIARHAAHDFIAGYAWRVFAGKCLDRTK